MRRCCFYVYIGFCFLFLLICTHFKQCGNGEQNNEWQCKFWSSPSGGYPRSCQVPNLHEESAQLSKFTAIFTDVGCRFSFHYEIKQAVAQVVQWKWVKSIVMQFLFVSFFSIFFFGDTKCVVVSLPHTNSHGFLCTCVCVRESLSCLFAIAGIADCFYY